MWNSSFEGGIYTIGFSTLFLLSQLHKKSTRHNNTHLGSVLRMCTVIWIILIRTALEVATFNIMMSYHNYIKSPHVTIILILAQY